MPNHICFHCHRNTKHSMLSMGRDHRIMLISTIDWLKDRNIKLDLVSAETMISILSDYGLMTTFKRNHMSRWMIKHLEKVALLILLSLERQRSLMWDAWKYGESDLRKIYKPNSITEKMKEGSNYLKYCWDILLLFLMSVFLWKDREDEKSR